MKQVLILALLTVCLKASIAQVTLPPFFGVFANNKGIIITSIDNNPYDITSIKVTVKIQGIGSTTQSGIVYNKTKNPTTSDTKINVTSGTGNYSFVAQPSGLQPNQVYYVKPYAITGSGVLIYGSEYAFTFYNYTGGMQTFTVPADVDTLTMQAIGGQGGSMNVLNNPNPSPVGGYGASMKGTFAAKAAEILDILVAGQGTTTSGYSGSTNCPTPGGGGGSFLTRRGVNNRPIPLLVAGGGAGASWVGIESNWTVLNVWRYNGSPGQIDSVGADAYSVSNPPESYTLNTGGRNGAGGTGRTSGGGGGFRGDATGASGQNGKAYPGDGGIGVS
uniref:hypothetical protein n=1 Tax=Pararcticibacter amylolyticus TaxID=2173175 RepID=UPI001304B56C